MSLYDTSDARAADLAADFVAKQERESRRAFARRPKKAGDVLAQLITKRGYGRIEANQQLAEAWAVAAGQLAKWSRPGKIRRGVVEVTVANSTLMQEFSFQKQDIVAELGRIYPEAKIRDLRLRVGPIH